MIIHVDIMDDNGEIIATHDADASTPSSWSAPSGQRFVSKMPVNSENENNGTYELFRITFQPHVRVDRPNGWQAPVPAPTSPVSLPTGFPTNMPSAPRPLYTQQPSPWGTNSPTPQQAKTSLGSKPTRGY